MEITKDIKYVGVNDYDECSKAAFRFQKAVSIVKIQDLSRGCGHILGLFYADNSILQVLCKYKIV